YGMRSGAEFPVFLLTPSRGQDSLNPVMRIPDERSTTAERVRVGAGDVISMKEPSGARSVKQVAARKLLSDRPLIVYGTRLQHTCWRRVTISERFKTCWAIRVSRRP